MGDIQETVNGDDGHVARSADGDGDMTGDDDDGGDDEGCDAGIFLVTSSNLIQAVLQKPVRHALPSSFYGISQRSASRWHSNLRRASTHTKLAARRNQGLHALSLASPAPPPRPQRGIVQLIEGFAITFSCWEVRGRNCEENAYCKLDEDPPLNINEIEQHRGATRGS